MVRQMRDAALIQTIRDIIAHGEYDAEEYPGAGRAGALMEQLLGIEANNDPVPDAVNWEIKTSTSRGNLLTLFHLSPSRGSLLDVVRNFGWTPTTPDRYAPGTLSFRCTISSEMQERGFSVAASDESVSLAFDSGGVDARHNAWLESVRERCGGNLAAPPVWTMDAIERSAGAKLRNLMLVHAVSRERRYITFTGAELYRDFMPSGFRRGLREGWIKVDFDARTQGRGLRDHGTKFRAVKNRLSELYEFVAEVEAEG